MSIQEQNIDLVQWPIIEERDRCAVLRVLDRGQLIGGPERDELEHAWRKYVDVGHCIAVSSCTHAIHLALLALGIGPGDEVIVPALTFCGTVNPVKHVGAVPIFSDILPGTYELDPLDAARLRTRNTKAVIPVHVHGLPCDIHAIKEALPDLPIIEDACQAHGAELRGVKVGALGIIGCFSLNQVKPLTGGQGGLVVTNCDDIADRLRNLASHGYGGTIGWSYGLTEMSAALALSQLGRLDEYKVRASMNADRLSSRLSPVYSELLPKLPGDRISVWHKYRLLLPTGCDRDSAIRFLRDHGVEAESWPGRIVPDLPGYADTCREPDFPIARRAVEGGLVIGSERFPMAAQPLDIVDRWADSITNMMETFDG